MAETTNNYNFRKSKVTHAVSESASNPNNYNSVDEITIMEPKFHKAAVKGNINAFQGMLSEQIESIQTPNKNTILHIHFTNYTSSVSENFVEEVLGLCPTLVLKTNKKDETMLHIAARYGHHKTVKKLIDHAKVLPKDINEVGVEKRLIRATNDKKDTALHEAARYGHREVVDILIKEEPDHLYFGKNADEETPLYIAVERQYWKVVYTILYNSDSPQYHGPNGRTALHAGVLHGDREKLSKLLEKNLSATKQEDENGWLPLHLAALRGSSDVVELLLRYDRYAAYVPDKLGRTALHFASLLEDSSVMKMIIAYCPDCCELVDKRGSNVVHYMMQEKKSFSGSSQQMLRDVALSNMYIEKDIDGNTPLHLLAHRAPEKHAYWYHPLQKLQFPRVDTMACNKKGQTVLDVAVADVPPDLACKNKLIVKLQRIGARLGGRVLAKDVKKKKKKKKQEKRHNSTEIAKTLSVVAILIATVTFTAGFTLPGGLIQDGEHKGSPILKYNAAFIAFTITDSLSFILSASAVLVLFLSSTARCKKGMYASLLVKCVNLTMVAMGFMIIAFGTGIYSVLGVSKGFGVVTLLIVLSFFFIIIIIVFRALKARIRAHNDSLVRVRDIQLYHTL